MVDKILVKNLFIFKQHSCLVMFPKYCTAVLCWQTFNSSLTNFPSIFSPSHTNWIIKLLIYSNICYARDICKIFQDNFYCRKLREQVNSQQLGPQEVCQLSDTSDYKSSSCWTSPRRSAALNILEKISCIEHPRED